MTFFEAFQDEIAKIADSDVGDALGAATALGGATWAGGSLAREAGRRALRRGTKGNIQFRGYERISAKRLRGLGRSGMKWGKRVGLAGAALTAGAGAADLIRRLVKRRKEKEK